MDKPHNRLDVSFSFSSATGCVTQREQTGTQEVLADKNKVLGCLSTQTLIMTKRIMGKFHSTKVDSSTRSDNLNDRCDVL